MSADIHNAKKQLIEVGMLLKQDKLLAAVTNLHDSVSFMLKSQLLKHEMQSFMEALDKAVYFLSNDRELKKIYPLKISYKPGEEKELLASLFALLTFLQENVTEEAQSHLAALAEYRRKQLDLIRKHLQDQELSKAQQISARLIDAARTETELKVTIADIFLEFSYYSEALEYLKSAYADDPGSAHVFNKLGMALRKSGHLEEAEKFYIQALEQAGRNEYIYFNLGRVYLDMKQWKNAISAADRALDVSPDFAEAKKMKLYAAKQLEG